MPTRLTVRIVDAGLPPELVGLVAVCGKDDRAITETSEGDGSSSPFCLAPTIDAREHIYDAVRRLTPWRQSEAAFQQRLVSLGEAEFVRGERPNPRFASS